MQDMNLNIKPKQNPHIRDTVSDSFEDDVLRVSLTRPVVVDFWAPWCEPCKQLTPVLEKIVTAAGGAVDLVKVDIEANPELAQIFRVQSVPMVYAFFQGHPVDGFMGARPESEIKAFVEKLVQLGGKPPQAEAPVAAVDAAAVAKWVAEGDVFFRDGNVDGALERYGMALDADPAQASAFSGIGWCLLTLGDIDSLREMTANAEDTIKNNPRVKGLAFVVTQAEAAQSLPPASDLEAKISANNADHQARHDLALKKIGAGDLAGALDTLIDLTRLDREWSEQKARKLLLDLFEAMGSSHPLTASSRRKLSAILFS